MTDHIINTQSEAVLHFFKKLDIDMVDELLDSDRTYADLEKSMFIHKLGNAFDQFLSEGDEYCMSSKKVDSLVVEGFVV